MPCELTRIVCLSCALEAGLTATLEPPPIAEPLEVLEVDLLELPHAASSAEAARAARRSLGRMVCSLRSENWKWRGKRPRPKALLVLLQRTPRRGNPCAPHAAWPASEAGCLESLAV